MPRPICKNSNILNIPERPITVDEACDLKVLLFGNTHSSFGEEWHGQSFHFKTCPTYGFCQKKAGPCGVLACVQAFVIYELLFGFQKVTLNSDVLKPTSRERENALAQALTAILWQAGEDSESIVVVKGDKVVLDLSVTSNIIQGDGLIEYLKLKYFDCKACLLEYFLNYSSEMTAEDSCGCILFLYSIILTHGIEKIKKEMDFPESHFIGEDGYCCQEVVNLILVGKAVPNLHDGNLEVNLGGKENSIYKGIPFQSKIGLLSIYEYQKACTVGTNYKNPTSPIWIIHGESHFTVLFGTSKDILEEMENDDIVLTHFDGHNKIQAETFFVLTKPENSENGSKENLSAVERCILTRWPDVSVDRKIFTVN